MRTNDAADLFSGVSVRAMRDTHLLNLYYHSLL